MRNTFKRLSRTLLLVLISCILGLNLYLWNARSLTRNQMPMPFGIGASVVLSGSMEPALSVGDLLIVKEAETYQTGDIVVYQSGSMAVVHRIVDIGPETATTRGDANNANDDPIPVSAIKGRVAAAIPMVGYIVWALKSPAGILCTLAAAVLLVELSFRSGKAQKEAEKEKLKAEIRQLMKELEEEN